MTPNTESRRAHEEEPCTPAGDRVDRLMSAEPIREYLAQNGSGRGRTRDCIEFLLRTEREAGDEDIITTVKLLLEPLRDETITAFFSYKAAEHDIAEAIAARLQDWTGGRLCIQYMAGFEAGGPWRRRIEEEIPHCQCFLLLMPSPFVQRDWPLYEAGYFQPGRGLGKRLVVLHHSETEVTQALGDRQSVPAEPEKMERFLTELLLLPNFVPGMPPLNSKARGIEEKAREIVELIRPTSGPRRCCGPHMEVFFEDASAVHGWEQLAAGYVNEANPDCRRLFDIAEDITPRSLGDWFGDVDGAGRDEGWVLELADAVQVLSRKKRVPSLNSVFSLPEGRFVRPKICAVTYRGDHSLQAVNFLFTEVGSPKNHSRMSPDFAALATTLEFAIEFRSVLERSAHRRPGRQQMRAFESALQTLEVKAISDPRFASDPQKSQELTLKSFRGAQRDELEKMYRRWEQLRRRDGQGELDQALALLDSETFAHLLQELVEMNQRFLELVSARFSSLVRSPEVAWRGTHDRDPDPRHEALSREIEPSSPPRAIDPRSIAVLPFENMSDDPRDLFADGMTEEIIGRLARLDALTVSSSNSVKGYKKTDKTHLEIARDLHVAKTLEGSVRREADRVRINARLIDAATDSILWAEIYERGLKDVFKVQADVAESIVKALNMELSSDQKASLDREPTESVTAYDYYLKGMSHYGRYRKEQNELAIGFYKKALEEDPDYALAHAGLAFAHYQRAARFGFPREESIENSLREASRAAELDPQLAEAFAARAVALAARGLTKEALEAELKAVELKPNYLMATLNVGVFFSRMGRLDESLRWKKRALALDPRYSPACSQLGATYAALGMDAEAKGWFKRALELDSESVQARSYLAELHLERGEYAEALEQAEKILGRFPEEPMGLELAGQAHWFARRDAQAETYFRQNPEPARIALAHIAWTRGHHKAAEELVAPTLEYLLEAADRNSETAWVYTRLAAIHALRDEREKAYERLDQAIEAGESNSRIIERLPVFADMNEEERFRQSIVRIEERVTRMRERVEAQEAA